MIVHERQARHHVQLLNAMESNIPLACVVQGGGMRGTYSITALAELERLGYTNRFNAVYASSAGAMNGAYFLAGQAAEGVAIYVEHLSGKRFINFLRLRPIIDINYLVDEVLSVQVPLNQDAVLSSPTELLIYTTDAVKGTTVCFSNRNMRAPLLDILRATAALPIVFGREIVINGRRYVDGGFLDQVPLAKAIEDGWKHIVVVLTRPLSYRSVAPSFTYRILVRIVAKMLGHSPGVVRLLGTTNGTINRCMAMLSGESSDGGVDLWVIGPSDPTRLVSRLTNSRELLLQTAILAKEDVKTALSQSSV